MASTCHLADISLDANYFAMHVMLDISSNAFLPAASARKRDSFQIITLEAPRRRDIDEAKARRKVESQR